MRAVRASLAVGSIVTGKPVKWVEDRSENLMSTGFARDYVMKCDVAATKEGKILAVRTEVLADHGNMSAPTVLFVLERLEQMNNKAAIAK